MFAAISNIFGYLLNALYEVLNNFGFAIIIFSILLRLILLPITIKQQKSMKKTTKIQGELKNLQIKYKNNPEMLNKETMELYKRENISPFSGCLSAIAQIIIILSVFYLVSQPLTYMKKANDANENNKELKAVVEEYKKEISENSNNKTRYIEIATVAKIREDYDEVSEKLKNYNEQNNTENINGTEQDIVNQENIVETDENNTDETVENSENNSENNQEENIDNNTVSKEDLEKRKSLLEKLNINMDFLGLDLSKVPSENMNDFKVYIIPALYVISSFISIKLTTNMQNKEKNKGKEQSKNENEVDTMAQMNKSMSYMMPIMAVSIAFIAPLGLALYWFVSNLLMILERLFVNKFMKEEEA